MPIIPCESPPPAAGRDRAELIAAAQRAWDAVAVRATTPPRLTILDVPLPLLALALTASNATAAEVERVVGNVEWTHRGDEAEARLTTRQLEILAVLGRATAPVTRGTITERCDQESAKGRTLGPLIEGGLVREEQLDSDGTSIRALSITPAGRLVVSRKAVA